MKHIKKHDLIYIIAILIIIFSYTIPDVKMTITGGWAWICIFGLLALGIIMSVVGLFGGSISFESEGLFPKIKRYFKKQ